jgi:tRNA(fMet)-specific endonuclease VapC
MKYLLDTNICVYWLKGNKHIEQKVLSGGIDNIFVSFITASELYYGAYKSERVDENLAMILSSIISMSSNRMMRLARHSGN